MQSSHAARNVKDLIKNSRIKNNANLLSVIDIISRAILSVIINKVTRKNDFKE